MADCIVKLQHYINKLPASQQRVAQYFIKNVGEVIGISIDQVALACDTSKTTVVRLCKLLGYSGYKQFCIALSTDLATGGQSRLSYAEIKQGDDLHTAIHNVTRYAQTAISDTTAILNEDVFTDVVDAMVNAPRIDFYGLGNSGLVALDAQQKLLRLGKYSQTSSDSHVQVVIASSLGPQDVAVLFSYSGETLDILDTLKAVRKSGALAVSVTRYGPNRLSQAVDKPLYVASPENQVRIGAMSSRIAMMHMVDLLFSVLTARTYDHSKPYLDKTLLAGREKRESQRSRSKRKTKA